MRRRWKMFFFFGVIGMVMGIFGILSDGFEHIHGLILGTFCILISFKIMDKRDRAKYIKKYRGKPIIKTFFRDTIQFFKIWQPFTIWIRVREPWRTARWVYNKAELVMMPRYEQTRYWTGKNYLYKVYFQTIEQGKDEIIMWRKRRIR